MPVRETFMEPAKDISGLLADLPKGAWVALAGDQESAIAFDDDLMEALRKSKEAGESDPIITRVQESGDSILLV
jgi:hypothetical protein